MVRSYEHPHESENPIVDGRQRPSRRVTRSNRPGRLTLIPGMEEIQKLLLECKAKDEALLKLRAELAANEKGAVLLCFSACSAHAISGVSCKGCSYEVVLRRHALTW